MKIYEFQVDDNEEISTTSKRVRVKSEQAEEVHVVAVKPVIPTVPTSHIAPAAPAPNEHLSHHPVHVHATNTSLGSINYQ